MNILCPYCKKELIAGYNATYIFYCDKHYLTIYLIIYLIIYLFCKFFHKKNNIFIYRLYY